MQATYGYNPLELRHYREYMNRATSDATLLAVLGVKYRLDLERRGVAAVEGALPRALFPDDPTASAEIREHGSGYYRVHYRTSKPGLLRVAETWYPGWRTDTGAEVVLADTALCGVKLPSGEGEVVLRFRLEHLRSSAVVSALSLAAALLVIARSRGRDPVR